MQIPAYANSRLCEFLLMAFSHLNASRRNGRQLEHCDEPSNAPMRGSAAYYSVLTGYCAQYSRPNRQQLEQRDARQRVQLSECRPAHLQQHRLSLPVSTREYPLEYTEALQPSARAVGGALRSRRITAASSSSLPIVRPASSCVRVFVLHAPAVC